MPSLIQSDESVERIISDTHAICEMQVSVRSALFVYDLTLKYFKVCKWKSISTTDSNSNKCKKHCLYTITLLKWHSRNINYRVKSVYSILYTQTISSTIHFQAISYSLHSVEYLRFLILRYPYDLQKNLYKIVYNPIALRLRFDYST